MLMRKNVIYDVNKVSPIYQIENKNDLSSFFQTKAFSPIVVLYI